MRDTAAHSIRLDALTKSFGGPDPAVDDLSLEIRRGEFFSLLGPSGCGKTTTLRMIAGFEAPTAGHILLDDREITRQPAHKRNMGMVFQNYALFPHRTVFQNVAFGLRMRRATNAEIARRVERALVQVELTGFEDRYPSQLSGGQQQRVALARAIVIEPAVLLCDEPLGALDKRLRATMQFELRELQRSLGITLVYVTHDQEEALTMSDRIAVMNRGRVEQVDTPQTVYTAPATPFVSGFIGESNLFEGVFDAAANRLDCAAGVSIPLAPAPHRLANMRLTAAIRPEHLRFAPPAEAVFNGEVREANFLGTATLYKVAVGDFPPLLVRVPTGSDQPAVAPGTTVSIGVNAEAVRIVDQPGR